MDTALLEAMEGIKNMTALLTGVRNDLIASGWTEPAAEAVTFTIFQKMMGGPA